MKDKIIAITLNTVCFFLLTVFAMLGMIWEMNEPITR